MPAQYPDEPFPDPPNGSDDALLVLLPLLIVLSTFLFLLLTFLICAIVIRRRRGIVLRDSDGPVDLSREELIEGEGGFEGVESRWLEGVSELTRRAYLRAKGASSPPACLPHIPLSDSLHRIPTPIPSQLSTYRHHSLPISIYPGEGCVCLVFRTGLRNCQFPACPCPHRDYIPPRPSFLIMRPVKSSSAQAE